MPTFDLIFIGAVIAAFCLFGMVLAWGSYRTAGLEREKVKPAE